MNKPMDKVSVLSRDEYVAAMNAANAMAEVANISISEAASKIGDYLNAFGLSLNTKKKTCLNCKHFNECDCSAYNDGVCDSFKDEDANMVDKLSESNNVDHPSHYNKLPIECIDAMIGTQGLEATIHFCVCNAFKYLWRHGSKNGFEDILKAKWYLDKACELAEDYPQPRI